MYEMKRNRSEVHVRRGHHAIWSRPVVDPNGVVCFGGREAGAAHGVCSGEVSRLARLGKTRKDGVTFRFATEDEVRHAFGEPLASSARPPYKRELAAKPSHRKTRTADKRPASKRTPGKRPPSKRTPGKRPVTKSPAEPRTIVVEGIPTPLDLKSEFKPVFEGHEFSGGPAVLILPGTGFRMERATKHDFPPELRDACRWS